MYTISYLLQSNLQDNKEEQHPSKDKVERASPTLHIEELKEGEAVALPGCPIPSELSTITSPATATAQTPKVFHTNTITKPGVLNTFSLFQMISSAQSNHRNLNTESKIKIFKMIGQNLLSSTCKSHHIHYRKKDCPWPLSSLQPILLDVCSPLLL